MQIIQELARNKAVFQSLLEGVSREEYLWKPQPEKWCLLEIVAHLYDEEREDFRARTRHTLETPDVPATPIDPEAWVTERKYIKRNYDVMVHKFLEEREASIQWLNSLDNPNWNNIYQHPQIGTMSAKLFLSNWLAHDCRHIQQIINLKYEYLKAHCGEDLRYAG